MFITALIVIGIFFVFGLWVVVKYDNFGDAVLGKADGKEEIEELNERP